MIIQPQKHVVALGDMKGDIMYLDINHMVFSGCYSAAHWELESEVKGQVQHFFLSVIIPPVHTEY